MRRVWEWLKKNWKYLVFPLWALSLILMWVLGGGGRTIFPPSGTSDQAADDAAKAKDEALRAFRERLDQLAQLLEQKLQSASKEQLDEFKQMKDKPIDEVAKWIDNIH